MWPRVQGTQHSQFCALGARGPGRELFGMGSGKGDSFNFSFIHSFIRSLIRSFVLDSFIHSTSIYEALLCRSGTVLSAGETA